MSDQTTSDITRVRLWDPALRLFHWALVVCVAAAWGLGKFGPNVMTLHFYFGYAVIGLLGFRLLWGFFGPAPARFSHFFPWPRVLFAYLAQLGQRAPSYWPGHNPVGALSVFALLAVLIVQVTTGLFADPDDFINVGPLSHLAGGETVRAATKWHNLVAWAVLALVALHLAAIAFYRLWKREDLVRPMITGWKEVRKAPDA